MKEFLCEEKHLIFTDKILPSVFILEYMKKLKNILL